MEQFFSDYIEYDKNSSFLKSKGNIKYFNKNQILISDYFEYNFSEKSGFIDYLWSN